MEEINLVCESLCILLNTELMLPQVIKSLLDLEELVKGDVEINSSEQWRRHGGALWGHGPIIYGWPHRQVGSAIRLP